MRIVEIFQSIDGEGPQAGKLSNFIRLAGCNLRCSYCDTGYALEPRMGTEMSINQVLEGLDKNIRNITLTGGEPLQDETIAVPLMDALLKEGFCISIETNGSIPLEFYIERFPHVRFIVDYKSLSSGMSSQNCLGNYPLLRAEDTIKFVVGTAEDLKDTLEVYQTHLLPLNPLPQLYISPVWGQIEPQAIVEFMKDHALNDFRLQIQLHKIIWHPSQKGV